MLVLLAIPVAIVGITLLFSTSAIMTYWMLTAMDFIRVASSTMFLIQLFTLLQRHTRSQLLGKVTAVMITLAICAQPIGQILFGWLFDVFINNTGIILLCVALVTLVIALYSKNVFKRIAALS